MADNVGSSVAAVFETPELLEAIMLELDMRTLILSHRVSQAFRATVASSIKLQRKLFFKAATSTSIGTGADGEATESAMNPLCTGTLVTLVSKTGSK